MAFKIDPEFRDLIPPLKPDEYSDLEESIKNEGVRDRLVVWLEEDILLDGHHRFEIATRLGKGFNCAMMSFPDRNHAKEWLLKNQFARRNLTTAEKCNLVYHLRGIIAANAASRMKAGHAVADDVAGRTNEILGKRAGVSPETFRQFESVVESGDQEIVQQMMSGKKSVLSSYRAIKPRQIAREVEAQKERDERLPIPLPEGTFRTIVADPPWDFVGAVPYPTESIEEICARGEWVKARVGDEGACLWLWAVNGGIPQALRVMEAWGFEFRTLVTWNKLDPGMGKPLPNVTEQIILATRGKAQFLQGSGSQTSLIVEKKARDESGKVIHSRKPDAFFTLVEALCLPPRLELYGRVRRPGWQVWGNQVDLSEDPVKDPSRAA